MEKKNEKPLTLSQLIKYNKEALFPFIRENFVTKKEFESFAEIVATKEDLQNFATKEDLQNFATKEDLQNFATKTELTEFKNEILTGQDEILKELKTLTQEKTVKDAQDERQKRVLEIHNVALKKNKILSDQEASEINKLRVF